MYKKVLIIMLIGFAFEGFSSGSGASSGSGGSSSGAGPSAAGAGGPPASVPLVGADTSCFPYCFGGRRRADVSESASASAPRAPFVVDNPILRLGGAPEGPVGPARVETAVSTVPSSVGASGGASGSAAAAGAGADGHRAGAELLMGIEVETSAIKVNPQYHDGFLISQGSTWGYGKPFEWVLEFDTSDATFFRDLRLQDFGRNLECRTFEGYGKANIIILAN